MINDNNYKDSNKISNELDIDNKDNLFSFIFDDNYEQEYFIIDKNNMYYDKDIDAVNINGLIMTLSNIRIECNVNCFSIISVRGGINLKNNVNINVTNLFSMELINGDGNIYSYSNVIADGIDISGEIYSYYGGIYALINGITAKDIYAFKNIFSRENIVSNNIFFSSGIICLNSIYADLIHFMNKKDIDVIDVLNDTNKEEEEKNKIVIKAKKVHCNNKNQLIEIIKQKNGILMEKDYSINEIIETEKNVYNSIYSYKK